jgi:hypothetical protein
MSTNTEAKQNTDEAKALCIRHINSTLRAAQATMHHTKSSSISSLEEASFFSSSSS